MSQCTAQDSTAKKLSPDTQVKYLSIQAELELLLQQVRANQTNQAKTEKAYIKKFLHCLRRGVNPLFLLRI